MNLPKLETPTYELTLPSTEKKIKFRPFLVKEHKVLLTLSEADDAEVSRVVKDLIDVCTFKSLDIEELPYFDIEYIFLNLRAKSVGENVDVVVNCECGNKINTFFSIEDLKVEKNENHKTKIMVTSEYGIEMKYPKFQNILEVFASNNMESMINLIVDSVKGIYNSEEYWSASEYPQEQLKEFILSLTKDQFDLLEEFFLTSPKIVQEIKTECNQCGTHNISRLEGLTNFFI